MYSTATSADILHTKGSIWHPWGFFGVVLWWHPKRVLSDTLCEGSLERTPKGSLKEGSLQYITKNLFGFIQEPLRVVKGAREEPFGGYLKNLFKR